MNANSYKAHLSQELMYELWHKWRNSLWAVQRRDALKAKTYGVIYWDRIMFPRNLTK